MVATTEGASGMCRKRNAIIGQGIPVMMKKKPNFNWINVVVLLAVFSYLFTAHRRLGNYALKTDVLKEVTELMVNMRENSSKTNDLLVTLRRDVDFLIKDQKELRENLVARVSQLEQRAGLTGEDEVAVSDPIQSGSSNTVTGEADSAISLEDVLANPFRFLTEEEVALIMDQAAQDAGVDVDWDKMQDRLRRSDEFVAKIDSGDFADVADTFYQARQQYLGMLDSMLDQDSTFQQMMLPELDHALTQVAAIRVMETNERDRP